MLTSFIGCAPNLVGIIMRIISLTMRVSPTDMPNIVDRYLLAYLQGMGGLECRDEPRETLR